MEKKELSLNFIWNLRLGFRAKGNKLRAEADKRWAEGNKSWAEADKLWAEADKFWVESNKLYAVGNELWVEAILEVYGNIKMEWKNYNLEKQDHECHLETGEVFKP